MGSKQASLIELQTIYSLEDAYLLLEVAAIDAYNRRLIDKTRQR